MRPELRVDAVYRNLQNWKLPADEFNRMFKRSAGENGVQNGGGFRYKSKQGFAGLDNAGFVVLVTNFGEEGWPDHFDLEGGLFTYYGDNRTPGKELHDTIRGGNQFLRKIFDSLHESMRGAIPPILVFCSERNAAGSGSFMKFLGLLIPGAQHLTAVEDLVAVWRVSRGRRFQNYRAFFSVLNLQSVPWEWLDDLCAGIPSFQSEFCPAVWRQWVETGKADILKCQSKAEPRDKEDQLPHSSDENAVLKQLLEVSDRSFEFICKDILYMLDGNFYGLEVTRASRDGGMDITGFYRIGHDAHHLSLRCFGEAKKWIAGIGVKPVARLVSRIKHREFGIFITTSFFNTQVQQELIDDRHPVLLLSGGDIARLILNKKLGGSYNAAALQQWLGSY